MANICRSLQKKFFFSPVLKSLTHIGFIGVKKNGSKISHLGTFNITPQNFLVLKSVQMGPRHWPSHIGLGRCLGLEISIFRWVTKLEDCHLILSPMKATQVTMTLVNRGS